jgi:hypothetical protein
MEAYCTKCKEKREIRDLKEIVAKGGKKAVKGTCRKCNTNLFRLIKNKN